jgi:hypothetical protein
MAFMNLIGGLFRSLSRACVAAALVAACGPGQPKYGDTIDGIACDKGQPVTFQASINLWLVKGNLPESPTEGIGSTGSCSYWVRTEHDRGVVHIRAPHEVRPTLATFFTIWDVAIPQGSGNSAEFRAAATQGHIVVNGQPVQATPAGIPLLNGTTIELQVP